MLALPGLLSFRPERRAGPGSGDGRFRSSGASNSVTGHVQMKLIRVLLADDHELFRAGIRSLMQNLDGHPDRRRGEQRPRGPLAGEAHRPNVVLMDIIMPELNGLDATARLAAICPKTGPSC